MKQTLNLKFSQRLTLTPQLKQSLRLLQLSSLDLEDEIQNCLDSNPLLERGDVDDQADAGEQLEQGQENDLNSLSDKNQNLLDADNPSALSAQDRSQVDTNDQQFQDADAENLAPEQDLSDSWDQSFMPSQNSIASTGNNDANVEFTQFISKQETLFEHLNWQIQMTTLTDKDKSIARSILRSLDEDGYLTVDLDEIKAMFDADLDVEIDEIQAVLSLIKTLDPVGVGARDLQERLSIFLQRMPAQTPGLDVAKSIVNQHLGLVATHNIAKLKKALNVDDALLSASLSLIMDLNPRIAMEFKSDELDYIVPDVIVRELNGRWTAFINPDNQSKLRINQMYANMLKSKLDDAETEFIQANLQQAKMFIKGLMSRYDTLLLVSQAIIERQQDFFNQGEHAMQPMVLQDIANELDMHESTISRATSGKYLLSRRGVYELKYFFSSALNSTDGSTSSSTAIRSLIKKMVDHESKAKPLSDNKIAEMLEQQGHIVARRTVAKYRESMQIAPSSQRKSLI